MFFYIYKNSQLLQMKSFCCITSGVFYVMGSPICCHFFITPSFPGLPKLPGLPGDLPVTYLVTSLPYLYLVTLSYF